MTSEKAIEILARKTTIPDEGETFDEICEAFDMAISALSADIHGHWKDGFNMGLHIATSKIDKYLNMRNVGG